MMTVNSLTFTLKQGTTVVAGLVSYEDMTATFRPSSNLLYGTEYTATITTGVRDLSNKSIPKDSTWKFTTGVLVLPVLPYVVSTDPANATVGVSIDKVITATFSKVMENSTINSSTFKVMNGSTPVLGIVTYSGYVGTFTPATPLTRGVTYEAIITTGAKDLEGNSMASEKKWNFTTIAPLTQYTVALTNVPMIGGTTTGAGNYNAGSSVTVVAITNPDFNFANWTENGIIVSNMPSYTFVINSNRTLLANYTTTRLLICLTANPINGGTTSGGGLFDHGNTANINAVANAGYTFTNWTEGGVIVSVLPNYTFTVNSSRTLIANFVLTQYTVSLSSNPILGGLTSGGGTFSSGTSVTVNALPNSGYSFANWTENGNIVSSNASYNFTLNSNRTLVANFTVNQLTVSVSANPVAGGSATGGGSFNPGASATLTATANLNYNFVNWTENGVIVSLLSTYTFVVNTSRTLVANFVASQVNISLSSNPILGGTTSGGGAVNTGSSVTVRAIPNSGYSFLNWTENGNIVSTLANYNFTANNDRNLVANFSVNQLTVSVSANPVAGGSATGGGSFNPGATAVLTATANLNYSFVNWTENGVIVSLLSTYTFVVNTSRTLVANFVASQVNISLSSNPLLGGSTSGGGTVNSGSSVTVMATPNAGYSFLNWTENGNVVSTLANYNFTANSNRNLVANFTTNQYTLSLSASPANGGTTSGGGLYNAGSAVSISATPTNAGFSFTNWTENGNIVSTLANYNFTINGNRNLVANFATVQAGPDGIDLGSAGNFAILAGSGVSNTGVTTLIKGDVGSFPTATIAGLLPANVIGTLYTSANPLVGTAKDDLTHAYNEAQGRSLNAISLPGQLGGLTLAPGLYVNSSTSGISGTGSNAILTLDAGGNPNAVWIFKMGSTLITTAGTSVVLAGGAQAKNIYWSVGTSATLGTNSIFFGNILADQSITLTTGATLTGRALTRIAAVSLDSNAVTKP